MSTSPLPGADAPDEQIPVRDAAGAWVLGWVIRTDTVAVQAGGLSRPLSARIGERWVEAEVVHETTTEIEGDQPWTALELPAGTLDGVAAQRPSVLPVLALPHPDAEEGDDLRHKATVPFWCLVFPKMRGCR